MSETLDGSEQLYGLIKNSLTTAITFKEIENQVREVASKASIEDRVVVKVLERFRAEMTNESAPKLLVDWGELPRVGRQSRPHFSLICPGEEHPPKVTVKVDRDLDHDPHDPMRQLNWEDDGIWTFCTPFRLTTNGAPCLPGQYVIGVYLAFKAKQNEPPRFFYTNIRLNIPDGNAGDDRVLEIDGDGQSIVNLHGQNLAQFSKVVLRGTEKGIINLSGASDEGIPLKDPSETPGETYEYQLKINQQLQRRLPRIIEGETRTRTDAISLEMDSGKRVHIFARKKMNFGRGRDNDVVLRFLPRGEDNDQLSKNLSRTHMVIDSTDEGILVQDKSARGIDVNYEPIRDEQLFKSDQIGFGLSFNLGGGISGSDAFAMQAEFFGIRDSGDRNRKTEDFEWDEVCFDVLRERPNRLWQIASSNGIDSIRFSRENNQPELEEYLCLFRELKIGSAGSENAIALSGQKHGLDLGRIIYAGRIFWMDVFKANTVCKNGQDLNGPCCFPLSPGDELIFEDERVTVTSFQQTF